MLDHYYCVATVVIIAVAILAQLLRLRIHWGNRSDQFSLHSPQHFHRRPTAAHCPHRPPLHPAWHLHHPAPPSHPQSFCRHPHRRRCQAHNPTTRENQRAMSRLSDSSYEKKHLVDPSHTMALCYYYCDYDYSTRIQSSLPARCTTEC